MESASRGLQGLALGNDDQIATRASAVGLVAELAVGPDASEADRSQKPSAVIAQKVPLDEGVVMEAAFSSSVESEQQR